MTEMQDGSARQLGEFLTDRDVSCPLCGYNLRNLADPVCPECKHELRLTVGVEHVRFGWFLAAVTPSLVSGVMAMLLLILMMAARAAGGGPIPPVMDALVLLGLVSGVGAIVLIVRRHRFIQLRAQVQRKWAIVAWGLHGLPFLGLVVLLVVTS